MNVSATPVVQSSIEANLSNTNITISGSAINTTTSDMNSSVNVSATIGSNWNSALTGANGLFNFNVTAPTATGEYTFTVTTNSSSLPTKTFTVFVSNISDNVTTPNIIGFIGRFPPFTNGTTFTVNITLFNVSLPVTSYTPNVKIFESNGKNVSWTVTSLQAAGTNASGSIGFNVTVPSTATAGDYGISVDGGKVFSVFRVGSSYQIAVNTLTTSDEVTPNFAPGSTVSILAKLRTTSGSPVTGSTVTAVVTYPNSTTTQNISLTAHPTYEGYYNNTFTMASGVGEYKVKVGALVGGSNIIGSAAFGSKSFQSRIEPVKNAFFFEWGGKSAFKPGESISLDIVSVNSSSGDVINWNSCSPVSNYTLLRITFVNGTNTTLGNASVTYATDQYLPSINVCKATFSAPSSSGTYNIRVNVTVGTLTGVETQTADGYFSVSNYFLKITPVLDTGGFEGFKQTFAPGTNVTIQLKGINVSTNTAVNQSNITGHTIKRIVPLEFTGGSSEVTNINQTSNNGITGVVDPNITFTLPSSIMGPLLVEVGATLNSSAGATYLSESATGTTFLISNYLEGFLGPQMSGGAPSHEGETAGGFNSDAQCSGTQQFSGTIRDVNTSTAAQGATIVGIIQAREDETGKDISSSLSIRNTSSSDSNGQISVNITFSPPAGYSFSGNYFMVFNASYKGKSAGVPSFFTCRTLNMGFPQIKVVGSTQQFSWQVAPTSALNITLTNVAHMNGTLVSNTSNFTIMQIYNFNPSSGTMQVLKNNTPMQMTFANITTTSNYANLTLYPQNYSIGGSVLSKWPNGFFDLRPRVISNFGTDTGFGGFMVVAFDAFPEFQFGQQYAAGSGQSIIVRAATNASNFTVTMGRPWEGVLETATVSSATLFSPDGWNKTTDTGNFTMYATNQNGPYERWNVTFTVPTTLRKGGSMLTVKIVSNATGLDGESVEVPLFVTVSKYNVVLPLEEYVGEPTYSPMDANFIIADGMYPASFNSYEAQVMGRNATAYGWNLTFINSTYGINSTSGRVCVKTTFNSTRSGLMGSAQIPIPEIYPAGNSTHYNRTLVLDRTTSGTYDTVIINRTIGSTVNYTILTTNSTRYRNFTVPDGNGGLYLWDVKDCSYFTIINTTNAALMSGGSYISNSNGGSHQVNQNFTIPYVVVSGGSRQSGVPVTMKSIAKQDNRGFGFEGKLASDNSVINNSVTNVDGVAFVGVNVTTSGRMMAFWATTISGETDSADMSTATTLEMKAFSTSAQSITPLTLGVVTLVNDTTERTGLTGVTPRNWIFNATVRETADGDFVSNNIVDIWSVIFNATNNKTRIINGTPLTVGSDTYHNTSLRLTAIIGGSGQGLNTQLKLGEWNNGSSSNGYTKTALLFTAPSGGSPNRYSVMTATENVTALVCAEGFQKPNPLPVENATVNVSVTDWSSWPPSTKYLDMFKISDASRANNNTNPILTSPAGCALFRIGPGQLGSWPSASGGKPPVFIEGTVTRGDGTSEFVYVGDVFRP